MWTVLSRPVVIKRANTDGSDERILVNTSIDTGSLPWPSLAYDYSMDRLYWSGQYRSVCSLFFK